MFIVGNKPRERFARGLATAVVVVMVVWVAGTRWRDDRSSQSIVPTSPHRAGTTTNQSAPNESSTRWAAMFAAARGARKIDPPSEIVRLRSEMDVLRDVGENERPLSARDLRMSPEAEIVTDDKPEFRWSASRGERYVVTVACNGVVVERSGEITGSSWIPERPLPRSETCKWQLETVSDHRGIPSPPALPPMFRILDSKSLAEIQKDVAQLPDNEFGIGLLYAREGARRDAEAHLDRWLKSHPDDTAAREILASIRAW